MCYDKLNKTEIPMIVGKLFLIKIFKNTYLDYDFVVQPNNYSSSH